ELFSHFRLQYALIQLAICSVLLALGRKRWFAVVALAAIPNVVPLVPYLPTDAFDVRAVAPNASLKLMAVNVEWRNRASERLLEMIEAESPDIVLVVELTEAWQQRLAPIFPEYPHRVLAPDPGAFGIGLLSRLPLRDA